MKTRSPIRGLREIQHRAGADETVAKASAAGQAAREERMGGGEGSSGTKLVQRSTKKLRSNAGIETIEGGADRCVMTVWPWQHLPAGSDLSQ